MLALALCGTAFGEAEFKVSGGTEIDLGSYDYEDQPITVIVDESKPLSKVDIDWGPSFLTLSFVGENTLNTNDLYMTDPSGYNLVGDALALASWGEKLTSSTDITTISLVKATADVYVPSPGANFTFMGTEANQSITLGDTEVKYLGYSYFRNNSASFENFKNTIGANEFAIVGLVKVGAYSGLYLVGKGSSSVPEPATATLSLLALAGLTSRRKRK